MRFTGKIAVGGALAVVMMSAGYFSWLGTKLGSEPRASRAQVDKAVATDSGKREERKERERSEWHAPVAQSRGPEWLFEIFTAPELGYDATAGDFVVRRPARNQPPSSRVTDHGPRLVAVCHALFPLQLLGYLGDEGRRVGLFETSDTHEVLLGERGHGLAGGRFVIEELEVKPRSPAQGVEAASGEMIGVATIRDVEAGRSSTLFSGERCFTDDLVAIIAIREGSEESFYDLRVGEEAHAAKRRFAVERIGLSPPVATIVERDLVPLASEKIPLLSPGLNDEEATAPVE